MSERINSHLQRCRLAGLLSRVWLACAILITSCPAIAGDTAFRLTLDGTTLNVTSLGKDQAFYPAVLHLLADGRWQPLPATPGSSLPAELIKDQDYRFFWPDTQQNFSRIENLLPVMVRYFDVNGASFGQIAFLNTPPVATVALQAGYINGSLVISPPRIKQSIIATWVLWPQEEGIAPLNKPLQFEHEQPPAQRIAWQTDSSALHLRTGGVQPDAMLLHETDQGFVLQTVEGNNLTDRLQRTNWLDASSLLYRVALVAALLAALILLLHLIRAKRT